MEVAGVRAVAIKRKADNAAGGGPAAPRGSRSNERP
jgi:hypothetical protein